MKKVSVIIPSYDHSKYIIDTINSVINQTYKNIEIIVVDDCSTDDTLILVNKIKDHRLKIIKSVVNSGISVTLNNGIKEATGDYIAILGSDDLFHKEKIKIQLDFLEKNFEYAAAFSFATIINEYNNPIPKKNIDYPLKYFYKVKNTDRFTWLRNFFLIGNQLCASSFIIRKECLTNIGYFDNRLIQLQDFDFWIRLLLKYNLYVIETPLVYYRTRDKKKNISLTPGNLIRTYYEHKEVLKNYYNIKTTDLIKIFPKFKNVLCNNKRVDLEFLIANLALKIDYPAHQLFAIDLLYNLLKNESDAKYIDLYYGFTYKSLHEIYNNPNIYLLNYFERIRLSKYLRIFKFIKKIITLNFYKNIINKIINYLLKNNNYKIASNVLYIKKTINLFFNLNYNKLFKLRIKYLKLSSIYEAFKNNIIFSIKIKKISIHQPEYLTKKRILEIKHPPVFTTKINNCKIIGCSNLIIKKGRAFIELVDHIPLKRIDLQSETIIFQKKDSLIIDVLKNRLKIKCGIFLSGTASYNYYHWLIEFIPRLSLVKNINKSVPLIIDEIVQKIPQLNQILKYYNQDERKIIFVKKNELYEVNELIYPSFLSWTAININKGLKIRPTDSVTSPISINYLRNKINDIKQKPTKHIYISRLNQNIRKFNEDEIQKLFVKYKFSIVYPELMTFDEQVSLFSQAKSVAGATGSGLTNIVFAPKDTKILCFMNSKFDLCSFSNIAGIIGQNIVFIAGDKTFKKNQYYYQNDFYLNPKKIEYYIKNFLLK